MARAARQTLLTAVLALAGPGAWSGPTCWLPGIEHAAQCGSLQRPLDPSRPDGVRIDIAYAVLPALSRHKLPDPVFFFAGGPGQSAMDVAGSVAQLLGRLALRRDIVLIDQRGTGRSAPLFCDDELALQPLVEQTDIAAQVRRLTRCRERLQRLPYGDLRFYTTALAVADADAVREALGAERVNLIGASYGTRVILEYLRQFPGHVRRAVLDGVAPPDMALPVAAVVDAATALEALMAACEHDPVCTAQHPRLRAHWQALLAAPARDVDMTHPVLGRSERMRVDGHAAAVLVRGALYVPALASALPFAIDEAAQGRFAALLGLASALQGAGRGLASGMHMSVICAEDMPAAGAASSASGPQGSIVATDLYAQGCASWPRGDVPAAFYRISAASSATLLLSGGADPATPPRHAVRVAQALGSRARHVVVAQAGHGVMALPCMREAVSRFVMADDDAQALQVDADCAAALPRPPVYVPPLAPTGAP